MIIDESKCSLLNKDEESEESVSLPRLCVCIGSRTRSLD